MLSKLKGATCFVNHQCVKKMVAAHVVCCCLIFVLVVVSTHFDVFAVILCLSDFVVVRFVVSQ